MTTSAIAVAGLRKAYGDKTVLDGVDLEVAQGSIFALLGPNGAGKTTTVNVLTTLIKADGGTARVAGHDVATQAKAVRAAIGVTGQFAAVDDLLTGEENLQLMADLHHLRAAEAKRVVASLLERFDLTESARKMASTYSGGMRRKLDLAMTLVTKPRIIFLDEPTTGLDPRSRRTMWDIVRELVADGVTVFLTTQYLEEADQPTVDPRHCGPGRRGARTAPRPQRRVPASTGNRPPAPQSALPAVPSAAGRPSAAKHSPRRRAGSHPKSSRRALPSGLRDRFRARGRSTARATGRPARRRGRRRPCEPQMIQASRYAPG
jgi:ABC-2 type transport system ATP-binding protein